MIKVAVIVLTLAVIGYNGQIRAAFRVAPGATFRVAGIQEQPQVVRIVSRDEMRAAPATTQGQSFGTDSGATSANGRPARSQAPIIRVLSPQVFPAEVPVRSAPTARPPPQPIVNRLASRGQPEKIEEEEEEPISHTPYEMAYDTADNNGTLTRREETKDDKGVIRGSYSYTDPFGYFRVVEYIADKDGFRASIRTNEPGVGKQQGGTDPAGIIYEIDPPPPPRQETVHRVPVAQ